MYVSIYLSIRVYCAHSEQRVIAHVCHGHQDKKKLGLGWVKNTTSCYNICAEGALPASITVIARLNHFGLLDLQCFS